MKIPLTPFIRIGLRYLSAALVSKGLLDNDTGNLLISDPQIAAAVEIAIGVAIASLTEAWHAVTLKTKA
jgi:acyl-coenzyme A thioesterase PaaI-like protein